MYGKKHSPIKSWDLPSKAGGFKIFGMSRAADATSFAIPEIAVQLDAGSLVHSSRPEHVFVSHTHTDHAHMMTHFVSRTKPPNFILPDPSVEFVEKFLVAAQELTNHDYFTEEHPYQVNHISKGVKPGEEYPFSKKGIDFSVSVLACDHSVPSIGFIFQQKKKKLKPEYAGLSGKEIAELRKSGTDVMGMERIPNFAFLGDTTTKVFSDHPELLSVPVIIVECTFLGNDEKENARRTKHVLWEQDLEVIVKENPQVFFVLIHFSHRYKANFVLEFFEKKKREKGLENILVWLEPEEMEEPGDGDVELRDP